MSSKTKTKTVNPIDMRTWNLDALIAKANELGVQVADTMDASDIIAAITERNEDKEGNQAMQPSVGMLFSLHSRTPEAKQLILDARNAITVNTDAKRKFDLFLEDREGRYYRREAEGVRVTSAKMQDVLTIVADLPNGPQREKQQKLLDDYNTNADEFQDPLLVHLKRRNNDGNGTGMYVMLYLRKKNARTTEVVF